MDRYQYTGMVLASFGVPFALYSYFVLFSIPLTAFGLSCIILGVTLFLVPPNPLPSLQIRSMLEGSLVNIEAILEEYNVMGKGVYNLYDGRVNTLIPISNKELKGDFHNLPIRVFSRIGEEPCVRIFPPGSEVVRLAMLPEEIGLEDALNSVLVDFVELVDSVKMVQEFGQIIVELDNPKADSEFPRVSHSLGSLPVSVAGCIISSVLRKEVAYKRQEETTEGVIAFFDVKE